MSELTKRVLVAALGIPLSIVLIYFGGIPFTISVIAVSSIALFEFYRLTEAINAKPFKTLGIIGGILIHVFFYLYTEDGDEVSLEIYELMFIMLFILIFQLFSKRNNPIYNITVTLGGVLYIPVLMTGLLGVRLGTGLASEMEIFISMIVSVWMCDISAFFIGRKYGKHKVFPSVSPNKSWEGTISGFIFASFSFPVLNEVLSTSIPLIHSIAMGVLIGIMGQLGDFAESRLKRDSKAKDSATILPGHGGFLDRFDSLLFAGPTIYIYLLILIELNIVY